MDPWKRTRLLLCLAAMVAMLGLGGFAWLRYGMPDNPFGWGRIETPYVVRGWSRTATDPFQELSLQLDAAIHLPQDFSVYPPTSDEATGLKAGIVGLFNETHDRRPVNLDRPSPVR